MPVIKALLGGLIGGGVGAYAAVFIQPMLGTPTPWTVLLAGLCAGLGVRLACGSERNFLTGVVAAVVSILALVGVTYTTSMAALKNAAETTTPVVISRNLDEMTDEEDTEEVVEEVVETVELEPTFTTDQLEVASNNTAPQSLDWSSMEVILNGLSAFLAYLLGTGSAAAASAVATHHEPEDAPVGDGNTEEEHV